MREEEFDTRRHRQPLHVVPDAIWGLDGVSGLNCKHQCESLNHPFCLLLTPKSATHRSARTPSSRLPERLMSLRTFSIALFIGSPSAVSWLSQSIVKAGAGMGNYNFRQLGAMIT
ncbi:hypothetical protein Zmor_012636 [Zophobas morio]|uniref:Uncharacterized protein n=1 Tax=Zophobas morio TaxID=2755281 RepID=A0AA38IGC1_9CUCU|nr:hypothetical protein Zmor_012636 [Zophobas morio]